MKDAIQSQDERFDDLWLLQCKSEAFRDQTSQKWAKEESIEKKYEVQFLIQDLNKRYFQKSQQQAQEK